MTWDASQLVGKRVFLKAVDLHPGGWGYIALDNVQAEGRLDPQATEARIALREEQRRKLDELARQNGQSVSAIASDAIDEYCRNHLRPEAREGETAYDIAKRIGLIGCISEGPPDKSTNPKYFEGFGRD